MPVFTPEYLHKVTYNIYIAKGVPEDEAEIVATHQVKANLVGRLNQGWPVLEVMIDRATVKAGEAIIDVGCGCGATSFDLLKQVGATGRVTGIDISEPMLGRARELAPANAPVEFVLADATVYPFAPESADMLFSRFGVMFFAQPTDSFANMRKALRPGGRLAFACWRTPRDNPWMMLGLQEAYKFVPKLPEVKPDDPGPFSFASEERVRGILGDAGY